MVSATVLYGVTMPRTTNGKKRSRPSGPLPPPDALVDLLRSDSTVLEYFTSLQASLDADVEQWKSRAQRYKQECHNLKRQLRNEGKSTTRRSSASDKQKKGASFEKEKTSDNKQERLNRTNGKRPAAVANENAFALSSDDDDDDDASMVEQNDASATSPMEEDETVNDWTTYGLLLEGYNSLRQLGISLVVEEVAETENQQHQNVNPKDTSDSDDDEVTITFIRRSNHDVVVDMMHAAHVLTRIHMHMKNSTTYPPFSTDTLIPCCNVESHPAAQGKECIIQTLSIMDVYCTSMTDSQWNKLFPPETADDAIRVGMRDRHDLVNILLSSILGEISDMWAVSERSSTLTSEALHYQSTNEDEIIPFVGRFGAKSLVRLSNLAEKCLLAQVVSSILYQRDGHQEVATLMLKYIISATASFGVGDYPRLQPVLSVCVIESMLRPYLQSSHSHTLTQLHPFCPSNDTNAALCMRRGIELAMRAAVGIWTTRLASSDERIADISRVEVACYDRLSKTWLSWLVNQKDTNGISSICNEARTLLSKALNDKTHTSTERVDASIATQMSLITLGDLDTLMETFEQAVKTYSPENSWILIACCSAFRQLQIRQIDSFRAKQGSLVVASSSVALPVLGQQISRLLETLCENRVPSSDLVDTAIKCCKLLSAGEQILQLMLWLATSKVPQFDRNQITTIISTSIGTPLVRMNAPLVRVINLKRRADRMKAFRTQAQSEGILVAKAVAKLNVDDEHCARIPFTSEEFDTDYIWGMHAFDGQGTMVEVTSRLSDVLGTSRDLNTLVESQWRPNDLKAFDKDARNDEKLVDLSLSECACALSHIASWKGAYRSLTTCGPSQDYPLEGLPFPFVISGYAHGRPLLYSNESMPPTPVCVILEDDAILVDRFVDRLSALLDELPRDFHFCSIGYSRPKTAPIVKYATHLGIPSCIWYLTGYILSLDGAKHLVDSLPVRGPVDSWIGLKMCSNWDNIFGQAMGVGARASSVSVELPSRKDLARILKFRAFAALVPLCSQKVDTTSTNTTVGRSWRQRDTDVTYSGNL